MFQLLKKLTVKELLFILLSVGLVAFGVWLDLEIPSYTSEITTLLQESGTTASDIMDPGWKMIGLSLLSFATSATVGFLGARVAASFTLVRVRRSTIKSWIILKQRLRNSQFQAY